MKNQFEYLYKVFNDKFKQYENYNYSWIPKIPPSLLKIKAAPQFHPEEITRLKSPEDYLADRLTSDFAPFFKKDKWYKSRELWCSIIGAVIGSVLTLFLTYWFA